MKLYLILHFYQSSFWVPLYYTKQGVHQKLKQDVSFPKPIATINSGILVFLESDIIAYEANKKELLDADYKYWHTYIKWTFKK